jgi:SH3-like domain-containing protein
MRLQPVHQSELINQLLLGTIVPIVEAQNDYYYVKNWDGYWGWINKHTVVVGERSLAENWYRSEKLIVIENYGLVKESNNPNSAVLTDLVSCALLKKQELGEIYAKIGLPDGQTGFIEKKIIVDNDAQNKLRPTSENIVSTSKKFLGIPYLWGGNSAKGFDCSGFVQTVFRLLNVKLPRDAQEMASIGEEIPIEDSFQNLKTGDLLFFGMTIHRITHVAIFLNDRMFIHAEGLVKINSLDENHPQFNESRRKTLLKVRRII